MGQLISFSEEMRAQGRVPGSRLLNLQHRPADKSIASLLKIGEGTPIWIVERLRLADDEVISLGISHLHLPLHVYLTPLELNTEGSLWSVLANKGIQIVEGDATIRATVADAHYAGLMGVDEGSPLLVREGVNYSVGDQPVPLEAFEVISRADRYQYSLHLIRAAARVRARGSGLAIQNPGARGHGFPGERRGNTVNVDGRHVVLFAEKVDSIEEEKK